MCLSVSVCPSALRVPTLSGRGEADGGQLRRPPILGRVVKWSIIGPPDLGEIK